MINLNECKPGDRLISKHGLEFVYVEKLPEYCNCAHVVENPNGRLERRVNSGHVYGAPSIRLWFDHDIVEIIKTEG